MIISEHKQGTDEWYAARVGIPTASNFDKIITSKGDPSKQAVKYMHRLAGERIIETREDTYQNAIMLRGIELEPDAVGLYEFQTGENCEEVGLCYLDEKKLTGASPDRLVGKKGQLEVKCPILTTQVEYLLKGKFPTDYFQQVQGQLYITGREWCDFVSFYPAMKLFKIRMYRDEVFISKLATQLDQFCAALNFAEKTLRGE